MDSRNSERPGSLPVRARVGFSELPPSLTAVHFQNALPAQLILGNYNYLNGSGVAAGDFDGDGWCDLYFCAIAGTNALYRNLGDWRFQDVTAAAGVGCPHLHSTGALFVDVDGDADLDLLVATLGNGVRSFINEGNARFRETTAEAGLSSNAGSTSLATADVDGDRDLDLYVANYGALSILRSGGRADLKLVNGQWVIAGPHAQRLRLVNGQLEEVGEPDVLYLNDGRGRFHAVAWNSEYFLDEDGKPMPEPWDYGLSVQMRDLNDDRFPDIYVCNDFHTVDRIWINDGRGRFRALPRVAMRKQSFSSMSVDFGDLDRDGRLDFFVAEMLAREHRTRLRQMTGLQPVAPVPGRFENRPEVPRNTLFRNRGDGTYVEMANFSGVAASDWSWNAAFLDVDLDGFEDLLIANGQPYDVQDRDAQDRIRALGKQTPEQSRTNMLLYPPFDTSNVLFHNRGDLTFEDASRNWGFDSLRASHGLALADFDNDGDLDAVLNCLNAPPLLYRNEASAPRLAVRLKGVSPNHHGIGAMVCIRGGPVPVQMQEILSGGRYLSGDDAIRMFAVGHPTNELTIEVLWRGGTTTVVHRAKANRVYEVKEPETGASVPLGGSPKDKGIQSQEPIFKDISYLVGHAHHDALFNDYTRQPLMPKQLSQLGPGLAWFDLDEDGRDELVIGSGQGGAIEAYRWNGSNHWQRIPSDGWRAPDDITGFASWWSAEGKPALLAGVATYESGRTNSSVVRCIIDKATGRLRVEPVAELPPPGASVGPLAVADFDGDGDLDLFVGARVIPGEYPKAATSAIYRQEQGRFVMDPQNQPSLDGVGLVSAAVWSDLDLDGFPELVLACEWGPIRVFHNVRGRLSDATARLGLAEFTGWWNGVATGDFDEDGRLDLVASNWGLNTGCAATQRQPLWLHFGRIAENDQLHLIEAGYAPDLGAPVPLRGLNALGRAFPTLTERFATHTAFARATVPEVLSAIPARFDSVKVATLATTLFLNRTTNFVAVPLPTEAQLAPAFSVNVADFDGDGHEDVFLSQNFFGMRPEWERLDAGRGLLLRGDGKGNLEAVPGQESGILIYGEQRGAAVGDFNHDGRVDLAVSQSAAPTRLFTNIGAHPGLRIRLRGSAGNPTAIGAILQLQFGLRTGPAREVRAGSGYWSEDSTVQVLAARVRPEQLKIRWPGGKSTITRIPTGSREIQVYPDGKVAVVRAAPD